MYMHAYHSLTIFVWYTGESGRGLDGRTGGADRHAIQLGQGLSRSSYRLRVVLEVRSGGKTATEQRMDG